MERTCTKLLYIRQKALRRANQMMLRTQESKPFWSCPSYDTTKQKKEALRSNLHRIHLN